MPIDPEKYEYPSQATTNIAQHVWQPRELKPLHREVIRQHVQGIKNARIVRNCKKYGVSITATHVHRILRTRAGMEYASLYSAQLHNGLPGLVEHGAEYVPDAVHTELNILRNPLGETRHRLNAAQDYMDRFGPPKISRQENQQAPPQTIVVNLVPSQLSQFLSPPPQIEAEVVPLLENPDSRSHD